KVASHPKVSSPVWIMALRKFLLPFGICLTANLDTLNGLISLRRDIDIQRHALRDTSFQYLSRDLLYPLLDVREIGLRRKIAQAEPDRRQSLQGSFDRSGHGA